MLFCNDSWISDAFSFPNEPCIWGWHAPMHMMAVKMYYFCAVDSIGKKGCLFSPTDCANHCCCCIIKLIFMTNIAQHQPNIWQFICKTNCTCGSESKFDFSHKTLLNFITRLALTDEQSSEFEAIVDFFNKNVTPLSKVWRLWFWWRFWGQSKIMRVSDNIHGFFKGSLFLFEWWLS